MDWVGVVLCYSTLLSTGIEDVCENVAPTSLIMPMILQSE